MQIRRFAALCVAFLPLCGAGTAEAELVFLTSGRTLSVKAHRAQADLVVLSLRGGGEVTLDRTLIEKIEPDEVPYPEPPAAVEAASRGGYSWSGLEKVPYGELIDNLSERHGVDPHLVKALIKVESGYRPKARSPKGAMGLMQIMPATARQYSVRNPYDPRANLEAGIKHLASLLKRFDVTLALAAYNAGEAAVKRFGGVPPYRETRNYVKSILSLVAPASR